MITIKQRCESKELKHLRSLNLRMDLPVKQANYYSNLEKGLAGEQKFDLLMRSLPDDWLAVNDLLFELNNTFFQIDSLLINHHTIYLSDVKNFDGDYYIEGDKWYSLSGGMINNPLHQLNRCETLLRRLLDRFGFNLPIEANLVFVNPEFFLYQAPLNQPIVFPPHLNRFVKKLDTRTGKLKDHHFKVAEKLVSLHVKKAPFPRFTDYHFDRLEKGIACKCGRAFMKLEGKDILGCRECGRKENVESAVLRNVKEFRLLFPDWKVTTNVIYEWCKIIGSRKTIRRILMKHYKYQGHGRSAHFVD